MKELRIVDVVIISILLAPQNFYRIPISFSVWQWVRMTQSMTDYEIFLFSRYRWENGGGSTSAPLPLIQIKKPVGRDRLNGLERAVTPNTGG